MTRTLTRVALGVVLTLTTTPLAAQHASPTRQEDMRWAVASWQKIDPALGGLALLVEAFHGTRTLDAGKPQPVYEAFVILNRIGPSPENYVTSTELCYPAGSQTSGEGHVFALPPQAFTIDARLTTARLVLDVECFVKNTATLTQRISLDLTWTGTGTLWTLNTSTPPSFRIYEERPAVVSGVPLEEFAGTSFPASLVHTTTRLIATP
jgi:hypothetical protein